MNEAVGAGRPDPAGATPPAIEMVERHPLRVLRWPALDAEGLDVVVTTRAGGVSTGPYESLNLGLHVGDQPDRVVENRRRAAAALGAAPSDLVFANQVHGRAVAQVGTNDRGRGLHRTDDALEGVDALVTTEPGVAMVILVADCVPIVLADADAGVLAVVHAGWRGTTAGVVTAALSAMGALGARPERIRAGLGPAIAPARYQVGRDVADAMAENYGDTGGLLWPDGPDHWTLDLWAANRASLLAAGVPAGQIHLAGMATGRGGPFFSDRDQRPCGRFGLLARIRP